MRWLRGIFLFPLGLLWGLFTSFKRWVYRAFDLSKKPSIPTWIIGNLHAGGQGKTPTIIAFYHWLKSESTSPLEIAILSRGYGRKTRGYREITFKDTAFSVGDEPLEIYHAIEQNTCAHHLGNDQQLSDSPNDLAQKGHPLVYVCEDRVEGIFMIQQAKPNVSLVLLDDGYQHLRISALGNIILTKYQEPFSQDLPIPAGNLREFPGASKKADIILVTHVDKNLSLQDANNWKSKFNQQMRYWGIRPGSANWSNNIYFASYATSKPIQQSDLTRYSSYGSTLSKGREIILITGVADATSIVNGLNEYAIIHHFEYPDHHSFTSSDLESWHTKFDQLKIKKSVASARLNELENNCVFVSSRKDFMRITAIFQGVENHQWAENPTSGKSDDATIPGVENDFITAKNISNRKNISELPFYVCHSEIEILFNEKIPLLNKILTRKLND